MGLLSRRPRLVVGGLAAAGIVIVAFTLTVGETNVPTSRRSVLLILGCWALIAALLTSPGSRGIPALDLPSLLLRSIGEALYGVALVTTLLVVCYGQTKASERLSYFVIALVVIPAGVAVGRRFVAVPAGSGSDAPAAERRLRLEALVPLLVTVVAICAARLSGQAHTSLKLLIILLALRAVAEGAMRMPVASRAVARLASTGSRAAPAALLTIGAPLLMIAVLPFLPGIDLHAGRVGIALAVALAVALLGARAWAAPVALRWAIDIAAVLLAGLAVLQLHAPDLVALLNQNYFLGPTNDVLHGRAMLVGTFSQYGVGMYYVLAGFFEIFPLGYGVLTLLLAVLTALLFAVIYAVVRIATRSLLIGILAVALAAIVYAYGQPDFYTGFPSTGVLRFGLPWLIVLLSVLAPGRSEAAARRRLEVAIIVIVGLASVWSGETGIYCLGTACALALLDAFAAEAPLAERARAAVRRLAVLIGAWVLGIVLFTLITRIVAGAWPHWGVYLDFVRLYTTQGLGLQPISFWSPGLALGAEYAASAAVLAALVIARPEVVRARAQAFRAAAGITALGALVYTYFLGRANPINLIHISPPGVALVFVWLGIALSMPGARRIVGAVALACVTFIATLIAVAQHDNLNQRFGESALGTLVEHPGNFGSAFSTLADNPSLETATGSIRSMYMVMHVNGRPVTILAFPLLESEALIRLGLANAAGTTQPCQEDLSKTAPARVLARVRALPVGSFLILGKGRIEGLLTRIDAYTLSLIEHRFVLTQLAIAAPGLGNGGGPGLVGYALSAIQPTWHGGAGGPPPPFEAIGSPGCG